MHYVLTKQLDLVSWYNSELIRLFESVLPTRIVPLTQYDIEADALHPLLDICGFKHPFIKRMSLIFAFAALILAVWLLFALKDLVGCACKNAFCKKRHGKSCNNFAVRFIYEFFLTFCLVICINISVIQLSEPMPTFSYIFTVSFSLILSGMCLFLLTRLCFSGPYVKGFYKSGTALSHRWGLRPVNPSFDAQEYIKSRKAKVVRR